MTLRLHIPAFPHTDLTEDSSFCAYSQKIRKFARMMSAIGYEIITYGTERTDANNVEHVVVVTDADRAEWFAGYDPETDVWNGFDVNAVHWQTMNARVIDAIRERQQPGDMLGVIAGLCQKQVADAFPEMPCVEHGIGYAGVFAEHRVFESYAWMHYLAAREPSDDIRFFDAVIPNYFSGDDFVPLDVPGEYLLYMGRMTPRKGLAVVEEIAKRTDLPVLTAGQGSERVPGCDHLGVLRGEAKAIVLANATALLAPTTYLEPFGGVAVEAMLSATPAITTDYGGFTDTVVNGVSGYRCRTLAEFMLAVDACADIDRGGVRAHGERFLMGNIAPQFDDYFRRVATRWGEGWYALPEVVSAHG